MFSTNIFSRSMSKEKFSSTAWPEHKVVVGFFSTALFCLLLLITLHVTSDSNVIPCGGGDCKLGPSAPVSSASSASTIAKKDYIRRVAANLKVENSISGSQQEPKEVVKEVVKVVEEWRLPAVTADRGHEKLDETATYGEPRRYIPMGSGAFLFILFGAYRGGSNTFAVVGLGTKGLHLHGNPGFACSWVSNGDNSTGKGNATKYYPDWGYGKQYSVVVVNCTFQSDVGVDGSGGRLEMVANHGTWDQTGLPDVHFVALTEEPRKYDGSIYGPPYKYDYLFCGSPLYGAINPQRMREWIAYHVWFFGPRSHFILYDAGGIHDEVRRVLLPWIKLGYITIMNVRQESRYDDYYYSQFLINNDCIFKAKTLANWTFFFDVDEYISVPNGRTLDQVMLDYYKMGQNRTQVLFKQNFMNNNHCRDDLRGPEDLKRQWGFEKLVYKRTQWTKDFGFPNRKYVIQARYALSGGVHLSEHTMDPEGWDHKSTLIYEDDLILYYHYHNTIDLNDEVCTEFINSTLKDMKIDRAGHVLDNGIAMFAEAVRDFENRTIGPQPFLL